MALAVQLDYNKVERGQLSAALNGDTNQKKAALSATIQWGINGAASLDYAGDVAGCLNDSDVEVQAMALHSLAAMQELAVEFVPRIAAKLNSSHANVLECALKALEEIGEQSSKHADEVLPLLKSDNAAIRAGAVATLGAMKDAKHVAAITPSLDDPSADVQAAAVKALSTVGEAGKKYADQVAKKVSHVNRLVRRAVVMYFIANKELAPKYMEQLSPTFEDSGSGVRYQLIELYRAMGDDITPLLPHAAKALTNARSSGKCVAAICLSVAKEKANKYAAEAAPLLQDSNEDRSQGVFTIAGIESAVQPELRIPACAAMTALSEMQDESYIDQIAAALKSSSQDVQCCAVRAIGTMAGAVKYEHDMAALLESPAARVRKAAATAYGDLAKKVGPNEDMASKVASGLTDPSPLVRAASAEALGKMGDEGSAFTDAILKLFGDRVASVRFCAVEAMGAVGLKGQMYAVPVARMLQDPAHPVVQAAVEALAVMGERGAAFADEVADTLTTHGDTNVRLAALKALAVMGEEARPFLATVRNLQSDPRQAVRAEAKKALAAF